MNRAVWVQTVWLPVQTVNESNGSHLHWSTVAKRRKKIRGLSKRMCPVMPLPVNVALTRYSAGTLDDDGLRSALKSVRDGIADRFGIADNDPRITFEYAQAKCARGEFGVHVLVGSAA